MKGIILGIKNWWQGKYLKPTLQQVLGEKPEYEKFKRPWLAVLTLRLKSFVVKEYKWLIGIVLTIIGLYIAYQKL